MAWTYLIIAAMMEVVWAIGLKYSAGFTKLTPSVITVAGMITSFYFLAQALRTLPLGTAYAMWTGLGAVGTAILGILLFGESSALPRMLCIGLIITGIIGLKLTSPE